MRNWNYMLLFIIAVGLFIFSVIFLTGGKSVAFTTLDPEIADKINNSSEIIKILPSELASHNSSTDCWVAYQGKVYDITSWLPIHPGSAAAIAPFCGTSSEFEAAFTGQHGTSKVTKLEEMGIYKGELE